MRRPVSAHAPLPSPLRRLARRLWLAAGSATALAAFAPRAAAQTLLHHFAFDGDLTSQVSSATGSLVGDAILVDGALRVSASPGFAEFGALIPGVADYNSTRWTVSVWARQRVAQPSEAVIVGLGAPGFLPAFTMAVNGAQQAVVRNYAGYGAGWTGGDASVGAWNLFTTVMSTDCASLWINGVSIGGGCGPMYLGGGGYFGSMRVGRQVLAYDGQFDGDIDDLRIYQGQLDDAAIRAQWEAGRSAPSSTVPEPSGVALVATGLLGVTGLARRRRAADD